jgi:hypothetical protein
MMQCSLVESYHTAVEPAAAACSPEEECKMQNILGQTAVYTGPAPLYPVSSGTAGTVGRLNAACQVGPCHHCMVRPRVAGGGTAAAGSRGRSTRGCPPG